MAWAEIAPLAGVSDPGASAATRCRRLMECAADRGPWGPQDVCKYIRTYTRAALVIYCSGGVI